MTDSYLYIIVALLPLAAVMVVFQESPYHALVIRGILGSIAAMSYAVLGAADVALTEALVGTMLAITLYAIAVRSSLVMRLGVLEAASEPETAAKFAQLGVDLRAPLKQYHLRLELVPHTNLQSLQRALIDREVHAICYQRSQSSTEPMDGNPPPYQMAVRVQRLYDILKADLASSMTSLNYVDVADDHSLGLLSSRDGSTNLEESHP